jgi:predicted ATPase/DNA-binding CsgD family transcriptional regulator
VRSTAADHLPRHLTSFVGRKSEQNEVLRLLDTTRLLTLTGAGGCGKTRLAARVAARASDRFPDGLWWVELAPIGDPELLGPTLAQVLGVRPLLGQTELEGVLSHLAPRQALVVLDNCEHVLEAAAHVAEALARAGTRLRVLATSREPLRAEGETEWRVPSLSLRSFDEGRASGEGSDAVRLFVERAMHVRPGFVLTSEKLPGVVRICRELDGIPLAIELAAARLRAFSVEQIADGLTDRLRFLTSGPRTARPRQQTLRASVDWSHELLSDRERMLFRRLGVFMGGFTMEAAERVGAGEGVEGAQVLELLAALVDKSLVQADEHGPAVRYRLLESMREYALDRLDEADETDGARDRHRDFFLEVAESIEPAMLTPRQPEVMGVLDPEAANLQLAIEWAAGTEPDKALRLCVALTLWWRLRSRFADAEVSFARALRATSEPSALRARALWARAFLLTFSGAFEAAFTAAHEALDAAEAVGDQSTTARALWLIGIATMWPDPIGSRPELERARELAAASGDDFGLMHATQGLGMSYSLQDDHHGARPFHDEALGLAERLGQQDALAWHCIAIALGAWVAGDHATLRQAAASALALALGVGDIVTETGGVFGLALADLEAGQPERSLDQLAAVRERALARGGSFILAAADLGSAMVHAAAGRLQQARSALETLIGQGAGGLAFALGRAHVVLAEVRRLLGDPDVRAAGEAGLELAARIGDRPVAAEANLVLGRLAAMAGEWTEAQRLLHEALPVAAECGSPRLPRVLEALAEVAAGLESPSEAARILGAARQVWADLGFVPWPHQRQETDSLEARVREALGAEAFELALAEGQALTADEAVAYVRRARGERKRPSTGWASLTPTELEVARRAASGLTNPEIAEQMFISRVTVRTHMSHIFAKLGMKTRSELAAEVTRREAASGP